MVYYGLRRLKTLFFFFFYAIIVKIAKVRLKGKMKSVKITVMKMAQYDDMISKYENPIEHACEMRVGRIFISIAGEKPQGLCDSAWESMEFFVKELSNGGGDFFDGWMKNKRSAMISCNDGFRPVSFLLETVEEC